MTFYSYFHIFSDIINGIAENDMRIKRLKEFETDFSGSFTDLDDHGITFSYILIAQKGR